jgi:asparagine synthase (glutamine-hydrolysing)
MDAHDAAEILPEVLRAYPEPMGDPSVFPNTYLSREARKLVTVVLTGDGADELFFGYGRYSRFLEIKEFKSSHSLATKLLKVGTRLAIHLKFPPIRRILRINEAVSENSDIGIYLSLVAFSHYKSASNPQLFEETLANLKLKISPNLKLSNPLNRMREIDVGTYLVDDILVKVDRASMAFGLETRAPFLDRRVAMLSSSAKKDWLNGGEQKDVLKRILSNYVSEDIFRRPKMGFGAPLGVWLRTTLNSWADNLVHNFDWLRVGVQPEYVASLWRETLNTNEKSATYMWMLLSLAASVEKFQ